MVRVAEEGFDRGALSDGEFGELALRLFRIQARMNLCYRRFLEASECRVEALTRWEEIPCVPAAAFKELDVTSLPLADRKHVFRSSGTTQRDRGRHYHSDLSLALYEQSLLDWFQWHLVSSEGESSTLALASLTPPASAVPESSLVHMFDVVAKRGGYSETEFFGTLSESGGWEVAMERLIAFLRRRISLEQPVGLVGTAFNFVQLLDFMGERGLQFKLPEGSCLLETGGYKGRTRALSKAELYGALCQSLGVSQSQIICEYGMSELSSQAYDLRMGVDLGAKTRRLFRYAPWARVRLVSPETGEEVPSGQSGLIQVFDLANVWSVMAVQTEDLGVKEGDGFELLGRSQEASAKGCSLLPEM